MLKNYIKIAIRGIRKNPGYASINIFGLTVGITCFILIFVTVNYEVSFDKFHNESEKIFRIDNTLKLSSGDYKYARAASAFGPAAKEQLPEVTEFVRLNGGQEIIFEIGAEKFKEREIYYADSSFFNFFNFPLLYGSARDALNAPLKTVLSEKAALRYFGKVNAVGEILSYSNNQNQDVNLVISAIMKDLPTNTHMRFEMLISNETQKNFQNGNFLNNWGNAGFYSYIKLTDPVYAEAVEAKLIEMKVANVAEKNQLNINPSLVALNDIHLHSNLTTEMQPNGNINFVYIFTATALFILLIAAINYMNLATARSTRRAKEVGMRKVLGAHKKQLITQFLGESIVITFVSAVISMGIAAAFITQFGTLIGKELNILMLMDLGLIGVLLLIILIIGLGSGSYPALFLSSFKPVVVLKGKLTSNGGSDVLRKSLVVFQFTISIIMMIGTYVVYSQLTFMQNKSLGFQKENMLVLSNANNAVTPQLNAFRNELLKNTGIEKVGASFSKPGGIRPIIFIKSETVQDDDGNLNMAGINIDFDYMSTMGINIVEGRDFDRNIPTDSTEAIIINQQSAKELNLKGNALGKIIQITFGNSGNWINKRIIGVVDDVNFEPLHRKTEAAFYGPLFGAYSYIYVKLAKEVSTQQTINYIESEWNKFSPKQPFEYSFLDEDLDKIYESEEELSQVIIYFSMLAISVACLGLFGLASFSTEQRIKEIGVRKVLGASVVKIVVLLSKDFACLIIIAFIIGGTTAFFLKDLWLQDFAFQTEVGAMTFILAGIMALLIALLTVSYKTVKAARANPIKSLRYE
jgi:putative ABC transport system permease protein